MSNPLLEVLAERKKQDEKWGIQNHMPEIWMLILGEEVGEAQRAVLEAICPNGNKLDGEWLKEYRKELIQVAAVAIAAIESLDRNTKCPIK